MGDSPLGAIWAILGGQREGEGTHMAPRGVWSPSGPQIPPEGVVHSRDHWGMGSRPYGLADPIGLLNWRGYARRIAIDQHAKWHCPYSRRLLLF